MAKVEFKVTTKVNGVDEVAEYYINTPSGKLRKEAREYKDRVFKREMFKVDENGKNVAVLSNQVYNLLKSHGVWTDEQEARLKEVTKLIDEKLNLVSKGKSEAVPTVERLREIVIKEIKALRVEQFDLVGKSRQMDSITVEAIANAAETDYLTAFSTFDIDGELVFKSLDDYYAKVTEPYAEEANTQLQTVIGYINPNWLLELPENKLLKKHGLIDEKGNYLLNGVKVNADGKPVNDKGYLINEAGERINEYGDRLNDDGELLDVAPF